MPKAVALGTTAFDTSTITAWVDDDSVERVVTGSCGRACGWNGPVAPTIMT
jgi:hypothetical protein